MIGNPETDTDNDFSDPTDPSYSEELVNDTADKSHHMNLSEALDAIHAEQSTHEQPPFDEFAEHPEDDEFSIDRQVRIAREEEARTTNTRLTAPPSEKRYRNKQSPRAPNSKDTLISELREKQMKLVDE